MNEHTSHLGRLLDEATAHYNPQPDAARFERMLLVQHRRRTGMIMWSAAACFALIGGTAFAFNQQTDEYKLSPASSGSEHGSDWTGVTTTEHHSNTTLADGHESHDEPTHTTLPHDEPTTTEKHYEPPHATEPKNTEPETTVPGDGDGETTTTEHQACEWSIHQMNFSSDSEPPTEVFWGTANPGDRIRFESAYGSGIYFADDDCGWEVHITFEGAPVGEAFQIHLFAPDHPDTFSFTYLG